MAISMSSATVDSSEREKLLSSTISDGAVAGGATPNVQGSGVLFWYNEEATGHPVAGITEQFAANVSKDIDDYVNNVTTIINGMEQAEVNTAFKGTQVQAAINSFIQSVQSVAKGYLNQLKLAETAIINSVQSAYATQDTDLSTNMKSDSESLVSSNSFGGNGNQ